MQYIASPGILTLIQFSKINLSAKTAAIQRLSAEQGEV